MSEFVVTLGAVLALISLCLAGTALGHAIAEAIKKRRTK